MARREREYKAKLVNGLPVLYCKLGKNKPWINISNKMFNIEFFSFIDKDNNTHSIKECEITIDDLVVKILFPFDADKILYQNQVFVKACDHFWSGNPKFILFHMVKTEFTIGFSHGVTRKVNVKVVPGPQYGEDIGESEAKIHRSAYFMYSFKEKPELIKNADEVVWESSPGEPLPDQMLVDNDTGEIIIFWDDKYFVSRKVNGIRTSDTHEFTELHKTILESLKKSILFNLYSYILLYYYYTHVYYIY